MDTATYRVVYDAADAWFPGWWIAAAGVLAAGVGSALAAGSAPSTHAGRAVRALGTVLVVGGAAWALVFGVVLYAQHARLRSALREGTYTTVEGVAHDVVPRGRGDYGGESWVVESGPEAHWYRYALSALSAGYRRASPRDGALHDGVRVRIADVGGAIARLEVAQ